MAINFASLCPHPPLIIPNVGKEKIQRVSDTIESMETLADDLKQKDPQTVIVISPHAPQNPNSFVINNAEFFKGHFHQFGDLSTELAFQNDLALVKSIEDKFKDKGISLKKRGFRELDHGTLVPLYYLTQGKPNLQIVSLAYSNLSLEEHYRMGETLREASEGKNVGLVASGDMSHRLTQGAPAGYSPRGKEFDQKLIKLINKKDVEGILNMDSTLVEQAGQCGYRSLVIALGALQDLSCEPEVLSYEGPFGVGYLTVSFNIDS
ncbi:MAG: AmmeMemoRadiSam system protein B [Candidatus Paceibacterota bacterium]